VRTHRCQKGSVLIISLLILMVMTMFGVSTMLSSNLQERMVTNQKQMIEASMAAESGAAMAIQWLQVHPEAWGDMGAWKASDALPSNVASMSGFGSGVIYWIESIHFNGDTAMIVSHGGVVVADKVMGRSAVAVTFQNEDYGVELASDVKVPAQHGIGTGSDNQARGDVFSGSVVQVIGASTIVTDGINLTNDTPSSDSSLNDRVTIGGGSNEINQGATVSDNARLTRKIRGRIIAWRKLADDASGSGHE
jgi:hypothetical protein